MNSKSLLYFLAFALVLMLIFTVGGKAQSLDALHKEVLHTQVRVRAEKAGGSGTVIWAEPSGGFHSVFVLTCHHVVEGALRIETKWDPLLARDRKQEMRQPVLVEFFNWTAVPHGKPPLTSGANAEIVAYDSKHDMALLNLKLAQRPSVAKMLPPAKIGGMVIGTPVTAVGCQLLHDPILTMGIITHQGDQIDYADYWMSNANIMFGSSGGAVFAVTGEGYQFIGIPSRIAVIGWTTPIAHMGYFSPITRVYKFFEEQSFDFLIPGSTKTEAQCEAMRKARREAEQKRLLVLDAPAAKDEP